MTPDELFEAKRVAQLIAGHISGTLSDRETHDLDEWIIENDENMLLFEKLTDPENIAWASAWFNDLNVETAAHKLGERMRRDRHYAATYRPSRRSKRASMIFLYAAAATLILAGTIALIYFRGPGEKTSKQAATLAANEIGPGTTKAILLTSNGQQIDLVSMRNQQINTAGIRANNQNNILSYDSTGQQPAAMNTLLVPPGGEYQVVMADGTHVWLNASSSLKYASAFHEKIRSVELEGEGYFEVAKDAARPFVVHSGATDITVKGTHFNVNSYNVNAQKVSLLEGKISITQENIQKDLQPNEEATVTNTGIALSSPAHIQDVVGWTKGIFSFNQKTIAEVMDQMSRWYNVHVQYAGKTTQRFTGQIYRNSTLQQALQILELTGNVHFKVDGRTVTVVAK